MTEKEAVRRNMKDMDRQEYRLRGSTSVSHIDRRVNLLVSVLDEAVQRGKQISEFRQRNLNYALIIFAGILTFSMRFSESQTKPYTLLVSMALLGIMFVFWLLDGRCHKFIHGWRTTEKHLMEMISKVANDPGTDIWYRRYVKEGEKTAEPFARQRIIFYLLIAGAVGQLVISIVSSKT